MKNLLKKKKEKDQKIYEGQKRSKECGRISNLVFLIK
jgi:hypothetical protein